MSIIEEALRRMKDPVVTGPTAPSKTERPETPAAHSWPAAPPLPSRASARPKTTNPLPAVTAAVVMVTAAFIAGGAFWMGRALGTKPPASSGAAAPVSRLPASEPSAPSQPPSASSEATRQAAPPVAESRPQEELVLTGIVEGEGEPYAMINGQIVGIGEQVQGSTLLAIGKGAVTVRRPDGTERTLSLPK